MYIKIGRISGWHTEVLAFYKLWAVNVIKSLFITKTPARIVFNCCVHCDTSTKLIVMLNKKEKKFLKSLQKTLDLINSEEGCNITFNIEELKRNLL